MYFPASKLSRHWSMYMTKQWTNSTSITRTHFYNMLGINRKECFTLNKTLNGYQQTQQFPCKLIHLMVQKHGQAITVMGCKDPSLTL
eukprot:12498772-Ditylum_brightwellii.AAC.1